MCPFAYYKKKDGVSQEYIFCKKTKELCAFTRFCNKLNKIIPNDRVGYTMGDCKMRNEIEIPAGSSRVRKTVSDDKFLYVDIEINGELFTHKLNNPYPNKEIPDYVYVVEGIAGYEIIEREKKNRNKR